MAETKLESKKKAVPPKEAPAVSVEQFNQLVGVVGNLAESVKALADKPTAPLTEAQVTEEKKVEKAGPNRVEFRPEWDEIAREVIGDAVDNTEVAYAKGGGILFTVIIKKENSNAPIDYLERYKQDRRTREVGAEGEAGVRNWCILIAQHLKRKRIGAN